MQTRRDARTEHRETNARCFVRSTAATAQWLRGGDAGPGFASKPGIGRGLGAVKKSRGSSGARSLPRDATFFIAAEVSHVAAEDVVRRKIHCSLFLCFA